MDRAFASRIATLLLLASISACTGADGAPGHDALVTTEPEPPGANCAAGGVAVSVGLDLNSDGVLQPAEVSSTMYVCDGDKALVRVDDEPAGENCAAGGQVVHAGTDLDGDGVLDDEEIADSSYLCNPERRQGIVVLGTFPSTLALIERGGSQQWLVTPNGFVTAVLQAPNGQDLLVSTDQGIEIRSVSTGALVGRIALGNARDMVIVPSLGRLYVGTSIGVVGVVDLASYGVVATIPAGSPRHGIAASPDGSEVVAMAEDGTAHLFFIDTATDTVSQDLSTDGPTETDVVHLGDRVVSWNPQQGQLRVYEKSGGLWQERVGDRVSLAPSGSGGNNLYHSMVVDPVSGDIYVTRVNDAEVVAFDLAAPSAYQTYATSGSFRNGMIVDAAGGGVLGLLTMPNPGGFEHLSIPSGARTPGGTSTLGLPLNGICDVQAVTF